ncbi:phosphonate ABC transporter, permease protein PhnE [Saccharibacillus sacchari]|uniref:phosphonate ABC transporter, permease protein PhnE n=1 Tax=Saccharibacillus sacchari TaxID=456493 RepID=UPI0004B23D91|nr:phosphonate ABC transporter, permease protein PhnE [Saccharibacillus sacchari]
MNQSVPSKSRTALIRNWIVGAGIIVLFIWSLSSLQFDGIQEYGVQVMKSIWEGFTHPDWDYVYMPEGEDLLRGLLETLVISILGTFISAFLCIPFAFWASNNMSRLGIVSGSGKFVLTVIRVFPEIIMAILFIVAVGPGAFAGVLALGVHSIGMLAKLYSETIEAVDNGPREALIASGASKLQVLRFAVLPQVIPQFISYALYRFEINIRSATVLGLVGAGGIGTPLIFALQTRNWSRVGIILLGIVVLVIIIDLISGWLRRRII